MEIPWFDLIITSCWIALIHISMRYNIYIHMTYAIYVFKYRFSCLYTLLWSLLYRFLNRWELLVLQYCCDQFSTNKLYRDPGGREASVIMGTRFGIPKWCSESFTFRRRSNDLFERFWTLNQVLQSRLRWHSCHRLQVPRSVDSQSLGVQNNSMHVSCAVHEQHFVLLLSPSGRLCHQANWWQIQIHDDHSCVSHDFPSVV